MRARDLAQDFPTVALDTDAITAAQVLRRERLAGLIVLDNDGRPPRA